MALVTGRMQNLHTLQRNTFGDDSSVQGILKSSSTQRFNKSIRPQEREKPFIGEQLEHNQRNDDGKRLVRFCDTKENKTQHLHERVLKEEDKADVIMFCNNMYFINNPDPNSAVRKLFPNSKLTPINPFINRTNITDGCRLMTSFTTKSMENNHNLFNSTKNKSDSLESNSSRPLKRIINTNTHRRNLPKSSLEIESKLRKANETPPLIERIKQLTCGVKETNEKTKAKKDQTILDSSLENNYNSFENKKSFHAVDSKNFNPFKETFRTLPKQTKEGLNLMQYNQHILLTRSEPSETIPFGPKKNNQTNEARRYFLPQENKDLPNDRTSISTCSTSGDTIYSLSDIDEALTDEEKDIKELIDKENKQDELELFVQQDASRTERLKKRYSSILKPENGILALLPTCENPSKNHNITIPQFTCKNCNMKGDKPKFGSTFEILQQLQEQIETPYQLEGRWTACSNYSTDSSIPISDRLFCDESSDCYEPMPLKSSVSEYRACSPDLKTYEEIKHFLPEYSIPRTESKEYYTHFDSNPYFYPITSERFLRNLQGDTKKLENSIYTSSQDVHNYNPTMLPNMPYNSPPTSSRQLNPILQKQYCRFPVKKVPQKPLEGSKVLTPPSRMHTYMNVPTNAPCYFSPPPYSQPNHNVHPPVHPDMYYLEKSSTASNIYENMPFQTNSHTASIQRHYTERERGVPEGASSSHDSMEIHPPLSKTYYSSTSTATIPMPFTLPHHYCVDV